MTQSSSHPRAFSARREELLDAAETVFATEGFEKATVRKVADEAGILSGSLYHHFRSKDQMAVEVLDRFMSDMVRRYQAVAAQDLPPDRTLGGFIATAVRGIAEYHGAGVVMNNDWPVLRWSDEFPRIDALSQQIEQLWVRVIEDGVNAGVLRAGLNAHVAYRAMVGAVLSTVRWYRPDGPLKIDAIAEQYERLFLDGLASMPTATS